MSKFTKIVSVLMSLALVFTSVIVFVNAEETADEIRFAVTTDVHAKEKDAKLKNDYPENDLYFHAENSGNLYTEAYGIFENFLMDCVEAEYDFILIAGDTANSGTEEQHEYFTSVLADFEGEYEIPVYVVPGNHDYFNSNPDDFKTYYNRFGYDEAVSIDDKTASYAVDLPNGYRLLAIDSNNPGKNGDGFNDDLFNWVETEAGKAKEAGKTVIAMMHHPLLDPIPFAELIMGDFIVRNHKDVAEKFTQWGIKYVFTGHEHGNNITSFTGSNGEKVYDVLTTSLTSYPLEYRSVVLNRNTMDIKCHSIDECNFDYIVDGFNEKQLELMSSDYTEYSYGYFKYSIERKIAKYTSPEFIKDKLKTESGPLADIVDLVMPLIDVSLSMPLYEKDGGKNSVEALAKATGVKMPESDYTNLYDLATTAVAAIYYGNENMPVESTPEGKILVVGLNTMLKYILNEAGNNAVAQLVNAIIPALELDQNDTFKLFFANKIPVIGAENIYDTILTVLQPLLDKLLVDDEIADRDVTLPGPDAVAEDNTPTFFEKLAAFFKYILNILKSMLPKLPTGLVKVPEQPKVW